VIAYTGRGFRLCDGIPRRRVLQLGALGAFGLTLGDLLFLREAGAADRSCDVACILLWLTGGPSHYETFDPKPDAPAEIRGPFGAVETNVSGIRISELLPLLARRADRYALLRSGTHATPVDHDGGHQLLLTGHRVGLTDYPHAGAVVGRAAGQRGALPPWILMPQQVRIANQTLGQLGQTGGYLGPAGDPVVVQGEPGTPECGLPDLVPPADVGDRRLARRALLLRQANGRPLALACPAAEADLYERAFALIATPQVRRAFDMEDEPPALRDRYGRDAVGQSCLLARRLVERGARFVTINWPGYFLWDTHEKNFLDHQKSLCPTLDRSLSALLDDLRQRGMLEHTLVVAMGEFGRSPKVNERAGRDHWPDVFQALLAGGGIRGGQVVGATDARGIQVTDRAVSPQDLLATVYHLLGIDPAAELRSVSGRPFRILEGGEIIRELAG
jgi:hypothetical protein